MSQGDVNYQCDPSWHGGDKTPAEFLILVPPHERVMHLAPYSFACCGGHLTDAMKIILDKHDTATVRKVNT